MSKLLSLNKRMKNRLSGKLPTMLSLDNAQVLSTTLNRLAWKVISIASGKVRISPRLRRFNKFLSLIIRMNSHHGATYTVKYLKACHMAVQRKLSSQPFKSLREIEPDFPFPRLINGLPSFIGTMDRSAIRQGCPSTIRLWLSILGLYRVLKAPVKLKLDTITNPWKGDIETLFAITEISSNFIRKNRMRMSSKLLRADEVHRSLASGPNCNTAVSAIITDAIAIAKYPEIYEPFRSYCIATGSFKLIKSLDNIIDFAGNLLEKYPDIGFLASCQLEKFDDIALGKLAFKEEAAGKLRVFAIVDIWTQSLFKPLHNAIFSFLKRLPNDGTFDQEASFKRCLEKAVKYNCAYSVDLSSATDRLPILLQSNILDKLFNVKVGKLWATILTLRPYFVRKSVYGLSKGSYYYYKTGQPMGCLSSWPLANGTM